MNATSHVEGLLLFSDDILSIVFNAFLFLVGIPGNCLIIRVYAVKKNNSSARIFIIGLAVNDLVLCLIRPLHVFDKLPIANDLDDFSLFYCKFRDQFELLFVFTSVLITACIALDRYYAVCRPFDRVITPQRATYTLIICIILSLLVLLPDVFIYGLVPVSPKRDSEKTFRCKRIAPDGLYYFQLSLYYAAVIGSQTVATVLCIKIVLALRLQRSKVRPVLNSANIDAAAIPNDASREGRGREVREKDAHSKTTRMLLLTTVWFILLWIPVLAFYLIPQDITAKKHFTDSPGLYAIIGFVGEDSFLINIVINPLIYSLANKRFRDDSKDVIRKIFYCENIVERSDTTEVYSLRT
ncbi:orexin receptor type 2-like [Amphiura filiformis]|uniref:orexin receptor type 2-like n=1 Tax=Amphiura filiformis TaxID=82378 RepID=UPI003B220405